jgi:TPR repeat protein
MDQLKISAMIGALLSMSTGLVVAADMDIMMHDAQRRSEISAQCSALVKSKNSATDLNDYKKGLCLLYGINSAVRVDQALSLLRVAAGNGVIDAQLALADTLQKGKQTEQTEALVWYRRAELAGDTRAAARYVRLVRRMDAAAVLAAANTIPDPPAGTIVDPSSQEMPALYRQGYHCHVMSFGQKWCHTTED